MPDIKTFILNLKGNFLVDKTDRDLQKNCIDQDSNKTYRNRIFSGTDAELNLLLDEMGQDETMYKVIGIVECK